MTENLWGVGSTAPCMHDGRETTLAEAILEHGGEAQVLRNVLPGGTRGQCREPERHARDLIATLENLVLFFQEE